MKRYIFYGLVTGLLLAPVIRGVSQPKSLSLSEALTYALEHNRDLEVQQLERIKASESVKEARSSLLPSLNASGSYAYYFDRQVIFMPGSFAGSPEEPVVDVAVGGKHAVSAGITLQQSVWNTASWKRLKTAYLSDQLTEAQMVELRSEIKREVTLSYLGILLIGERIELEKQSLERNQRAFLDSRNLLRQGKALRVDTLHNYIATQNSKATLSHLESRLLTAKAEFKTLLGFKASEEVTLTDSLVSNQAGGEGLPGLDQAENLAFQLRPDLSKQQLFLKLSASQLATVQAERLPTVSAFGQLQAQGQRDDLRLGSYGWPRTSYLGAQVNVPIFSGLRTEARVQQSKLATRQQEIRLTYLKEKIRNELAARLSSVRDAYARTQVGKETVAATQVGYGQVAERYRLGLATRLELTDAELSLSQARINHLQALYDWQVAQVELQKATGQL